MKILIISPGKKHDETVQAGVAEYQKRLEKRFEVEWNMPAASTLDTEAKDILKALKDTDYVVLLDEKGKDVDTLAFARLVETHMNSGTKRLVFIIGGAFGVHENVKKRSNITLRLSSLVFPHMLVRLILVEQLYRALSILEGGKYHHA